TAFQKNVERLVGSAGDYSKAVMVDKNGDVISDPNVKSGDWTMTDVGTSLLASPNYSADFVKSQLEGDRQTPVEAGVSEFNAKFDPAVRSTYQALDYASGGRISAFGLNRSIAEEKLKTSKDPTLKAIGNALPIADSFALTPGGTALVNADHSYHYT